MSKAQSRGAARVGTGTAIVNYLQRPLAPWHVVIDRPCRAKSQTDLVIFQNEHKMRPCFSRWQTQLQAKLTRLNPTW